MSEEQKPRRNIPRASGAMQSATWHEQYRTRKQKDSREHNVHPEVSIPEGSEVRKKNTNNRSLMQSKDNQSFNRKVLCTVEFVGHQAVDENHVPDYLITLERNTKLATKDLQLFASEYRPSTVWENIRLGLDKLHVVWTKMKEAVNDLRLYVPMINDSQFPEQVLSLESITDEPSYIQGQEVCATILTRIIQEAYDAFQPYFNNVIQLIAMAFREEDNVVQPSSLTGIAIATRTIRLLGMLMEVEQQLERIGDEKYKITLATHFFTQRDLNILNLLDELCRHLESLQRSFFQSKHLYVKGKPAIAKFKSMAEILRRCWKEAVLLVRHLRKIRPDLKDRAHQKFGHLLCRAGSLVAEMQDSPHVQAYVAESDPIQYEDEVVDDIVQSQLWLLPCLDDLVTIGSQLVKKIRQCAQDPERLSNEASELIFEIKSVMYNVVMMAIARSSWLISWTVSSPSPKLHPLKDQGSASLLLVLNYNKGGLSLRCSATSPKEDMQPYGAFVYSTNSLRNGVHQVHGMIGKESEIAAAFGTITTPGDPDTGEESDMIQFHKIKGLEGLVPKFSLKAFPLDLETSIESDVSGLVSEVSNLNKQLTDAVEDLVETTLISDDELPPAEIESSPSVNSDVASSACSVELQTGFTSILPSESSEQASPAAGIALAVEIPPSKTHSGPSRVSPFINQMPTSGMPTPTRNNVGSGESIQEHLESSGTAQMNLRTGSAASTEPSEGIKNVSAAELTDGSMIGKGAGGTVFKMSYNPRPVAVKIMNESTVRTKEKFKKETRLHRRLSKHPNIVEFVGTCRQFQQKEDRPGPSLVMIMELCELGDLFKILCDARWVRDKKNFNQDITEYMSSRGYMIYNDWSLRLQVACDITAGMAHMHSQGIVHRDLTSYNVVVKKGDAGQWITKVCDFERSREIPESGMIPRSDTFANSPAWAAPEIIDNRDYSTQADVFSMGVILWEIVTLEEPNELFMDLMRTEGAGSHEKRRLLLLEKLIAPSEQTLPEFPRLATEIKQCLSEEENNRPIMIDLHHSLLELKNSITARMSPFQN